MASYLGRRKFLATLGGTAATWPLAARGQQSAMPVIGYLHSGTTAQFEAQPAAFHRGLKEGSYVAGQNVAIEYRWAEGKVDRLPDWAADLVRGKVNVIATAGGPPSKRGAGVPMLWSQTKTFRYSPIVSAPNWGCREKRAPALEGYGG